MIHHTLSAFKKAPLGVKRKEKGRPCCVSYFIVWAFFVALRRSIVNVGKKSGRRKKRSLIKRNDISSIGNIFTCRLSINRYKLISRWKQKENEGQAVFFRRRLNTFFRRTFRSSSSSPPQTESTLFAVDKRLLGGFLCLSVCCP